MQKSRGVTIRVFAMPERPEEKPCAAVSFVYLSDPGGRIRTIGGSPYISF